MLKGRNLLAADSFSRSELLEVVQLGQRISKSPQQFSELAKGKLLGTLFFEPSTRTRLSFESAICRLGGQYIGFSEAGNSSTAKGESLQDTIRTVSQYVDCIVMRHPREGAAQLAAQVTEVPLINAGDGGHQHPTQTLTDLLCMQSVKGRLEGLTIGLCGDLKYGRTVHSLLKVMSLFPGNRFLLISPNELQLPSYLKTTLLEAQKLNYLELTSLEKALPELDVLYMTRIQKERFYSQADYTKVKDAYLLDKSMLGRAKEDLAILHPLPRVNEIATDVDQDPRAVYFQQAKCGMYVRMALIAKLMGLPIPEEG